MSMQFTKVLPQLPLLIDAEVLLIPEEHNTPRCNQPSEIVLLRICEVRQVHAVNLSPDLGVVVEDVGGRGEEVLEVRVA
jgi:hypothetical protein